VDALEYITSELFIHDELLRRAKGGLDMIPAAYKRFGKLAPFMISFPSTRVYLDDGRPHEAPVLCDLPDNRSEWKKEITGFIIRTKPYALLLAEQHDNEVVVIFESQHGTQSWHWPLKRHGDVRVLGDRTSKKDTASIGILWRAQTAQA